MPSTRPVDPAALPAATRWTTPLRRERRPRRATWLPPGLLPQRRLRSRTPVSRCSRPATTPGTLSSTNRTALRPRRTQVDRRPQGATTPRATRPWPQRITAPRRCTRPRGFRRWTRPRKPCCRRCTRSHRGGHSGRASTNNPSRRSAEASRPNHRIAPSSALSHTPRGLRRTFRINNNSISNRSSIQGGRPPWATRSRPRAERPRSRRRARPCTRRRAELEVNPSRRHPVNIMIRFQPAREPTARRTLQSLAARWRASSAGQFSVLRNDASCFSSLDDTDHLLAGDTGLSGNVFHRRQKMKCEGPSKSPCRRCRAAGVECVFESPTSAVPRARSGGNAAQSWIDGYATPSKRESSLRAAELTLMPLLRQTPTVVRIALDGPGGFGRRSERRSRTPRLERQSICPARDAVGA